MTVQVVTSDADMRFGEITEARAGWLSPALMGIAAPVVVGLFLAPQLLQGAATIVMMMLGLVLLLSAAVYGLSVVAPGAPRGFAVRAASSEVAIVRQGIVAQTEVVIPFKQIARLSLVRGADHDGYDANAIELRTRDGEIWIIPGDIDAADLERMRRLIGATTRSR